MGRIAALTLCAVSLSAAATPPATAPADTVEAREAAAMRSFDAERYDEAAQEARAALELAAPLGPNHPRVGELTGLVAVMDHARGATDAAREGYRAAIAILSKHPAHWMLALSWRRLGLMARDDGQRDEAVAALEKAAAVYAETYGPHDGNLAVCLEDLQEIARSRSDHTSAAGYLERLVVIYRTLDDQKHPRLAKTLSVQGEVLDRLNKLDEAAAAYEESATIYATHAEHLRSAAWVRSTLGSLEYRRGRYEAARRAYEQALELGRDAATPADRWRTLNALGMALMELGRHAEAQARLTEAATVGEQLGEPIGHTLNNLAMSYRRAGEFARAVPVYERAIALLQKDPLQSVTAAVAMDNLANCLVDLARYDRARLLYEEAERVFQKMGGLGKDRLARNAAGQGRLAKHVGDYEAALKHARRAYDLLVEWSGPTHPDVGVAADNLATAYADLGRFPEALTFYDQALAIHETLGAEHPRVAVALNNAAWVLKELRRYDEARQRYERALALAEKAHGRDHPVTTAALSALGETLRALGQVERARALQKDAVARTSRALGPKHPYVAERRAAYALTLLAAGDRKAARKEALAALAVAEHGIASMLWSTSERERLSLVQAHRGTLELALSLVGEADRSWDLALRWKAAVMNSLMSQQRTLRAAADPAVEQGLARLAELRRALATATIAEPGSDERQAHLRHLETLRTDKERLERTLSRASAGFREARAFESAGLKAVCGALSPGQALVDFVRYHGAKVGEGRVLRTPQYAAFVVTGGGCGSPRRIELGPAEPIESAVADLRRLLGEAAEAGEAIDGLRAVRKRVWDPLVAALGDARFVWLVPDGALHGVPFAALPLGEPALPEETRFLVEQLTVSTLPTARDILRLGERDGGRSTQRLIVGGVQYDGGAAAPVTASRGAGCGLSGKREYGYLPGTAQEADAVAARLGGEVRVLRGLEATEEAVTAALQSSRVVHLATHGYFADGCRSAIGDAEGVGVNPLLLSGVALAGANRDRSAGGADGILTAEEVASLDLSSVELAVLSACETGLGDVAAGEGVLGLRWAFSVAGAGALVMSLWKVPDEETRELMTALYGRLDEGAPLKVADALRGAQLALLKTLRERGDPNPWLWAAFITTGR